MAKKFSLWNITFETLAELILIFTAAATGAIIGQGKQLTNIEWVLAIIFILCSISLKKVSKIKNPFSK
jgi:hypothetical protein